MKLLTICSELVSSARLFATKEQPLMVPVHSLMDTLIVIIQLMFEETRMRHKGEQIIVCPRGDGSKKFVEPNAVGDQTAELNKTIDQVYRAGFVFAFRSM